MFLSVEITSYSYELLSALLKEDEMNKSRYEHLFAHIHTHCQQLAQDALRFRPHAFERPDLPREINILTSDPATDLYGYMEIEEDEVSWYVDTSHSFLSLKKDFPEQKPTFAFLPATKQQILETEQLLGFSLPPLLRLLYTQMANGGFGPGNGIIGAIGGYGGLPGVGSADGNIARRYHHEINFANAQIQLWRDGWHALTPEAREAFRREGIVISPEMWEAARPSNNKRGGEADNKAERILPPAWPEHLLELCEWGCNISTYIHADTGQIMQGQKGPIMVVADSLEEWLERWLAGEALQFL